MQYYRFGRVVVPEGGLFDDYDSAIAFIESLEEEVISEMVKDLSFTTDADGTLSVLINNKRFFITLSALKDLCKHLKIPAGFINKFPGRDLVLENLNNNPYLKENSDLVKLVIWKGEEQPVIAGVLPGEDPAMSAGEFLSLMNDGQAFERETTKLDQIAFTGEEMVVYFYLPEEMSREGYGFNLGFALHYSATRPVDTFVLPFGKMSVVANTGEPFDFDFETGTKLHVGRRKREDFLDKTIELGQTYIGDDLGVLYEDFTKYGMVARNIDSVKFAIL
nr:hypothetical protein [Calditrichia bacterium]